MVLLRERGNWTWKKDFRPLFFAGMNLRETPEENAKEEIPGGDGDFYLENGFVVFTERYHLERGWCCHSGCRHCPYDKDVTTI